MMYFSPLTLFLVTSFIVLMNVALYGAVFFSFSILARLGLKSLAKQSPERRQRLARYIGISAIVLMSLGGTAFSYVRAYLNYRIQVRDNVASGALPVRPKHISLVFNSFQNGESSDRACDGLCQSLLLGKEVETVDVLVGNSKHFIISSFHLEQGGTCVTDTNFQGKFKILDQTVAAAIKGVCITSGPRPETSEIIAIELNDEGPDGARIAEIKDINTVFYKNSSLKYEVLRGGSVCLDSAPRILSGFLPGCAERGTMRFCCCVGRA